MKRHRRRRIRIIKSLLLIVVAIIFGSAVFAESGANKQELARPSEHPTEPMYHLIPLRYEDELPVTAAPQRLAQHEPDDNPEEELEASNPEYSEKDVELLACVIFQEAGCDLCSDTTRKMVADVVLNRVMDERFPNSIEEVLTQKWQYGRFWITGVCWPESASYECNKQAVERAVRIAREVLAGDHSELYGSGYIWQAEFEQGSSGFWADGIFFGR